MRAARMTLPILAVVISLLCLGCGGPPPDVPPDAVEPADAASPVIENATRAIGVVSATEQGLPPELQ